MTPINMNGAIQVVIDSLVKNEDIDIDWVYSDISDHLDFIVKGKNYSIKQSVSKFQIEQCHNIAEVIINYISPVVEKVKFMDKGGSLGFAERDLDTIKTFKTFAEGVMSTVAPTGAAAYLESHLVFAGGAFTSVYHGDQVKDFDIFILKNNPQVRDWIGKSNLESPGRFTFSDSSYLRNKNINLVMLDNSTKVQYIFTHYKTREELIDHFDLEHTCVSYHMGKLYVSALTLDCIKRKKLKPHNGNKPDDWRIDKFMKRGFTFESNSLERI